MIIQNIYSRIRKRIPENLGVTKETTPIIYFGEYNKAKACTISLNPSDREFLDRNGLLLMGNKERLCSRRKLAKEDYSDLDDTDCQEVLKSCEQYFQKNPYKNWFNKYESFLNYFGYSYYNGSVVHLDLVQWATTPFWGELTKSQKNELLLQDLPFLEKLLEKKFDYIFLNGKTVVSEISSHLNIQLEETSSVFSGRNIFLYAGIYQGSKVLGWSPYIQSANVGGYGKIQELAKLVKENIA